MGYMLRLRRRNNVHLRVCIHRVDIRIHREDDSLLRVPGHQLIKWLGSPFKPVCFVKLDVKWRRLMKPPKVQKLRRLIHQFTMLTSSLNEEQVNVLGQNLEHVVNTAISTKRLASSLSSEEDEELVVNPPKRVQVSPGKGKGKERAQKGRWVQKMKQSEDEEREVQSEDEEEDDNAQDAKGGGPSQPSKASTNPHPEPPSLGRNILPALMESRPLCLLRKQLPASLSIKRRPDTLWVLHVRSLVQALHDTANDREFDELEFHVQTQIRVAVRDILSNMITFGATKIDVAVDSGLLSQYYLPGFATMTFAMVEHFVSYCGFTGDEDPVFREDIFDTLSLLQCSMVASPGYASISRVQARG
ncbi:hypothetical protein B0H13DRAFT_2310585 [Mycena leptocephala]|nr:hypothetical protein B0H13DRAFT_2310585 [Mycena leptocephala]